MMFLHKLLLHSIKYTYILQKVENTNIYIKTQNPYFNKQNKLYLLHSLHEKCKRNDIKFSRNTNSLGFNISQH